MFFWYKSMLVTVTFAFYRGWETWASKLKWRSLVNFKPISILDLYVDLIYIYIYSKSVAPVTFLLKMKINMQQCSTRA